MDVKNPHYFRVRIPLLDGVFSTAADFAPPLA